MSKTTDRYQELLTNKYLRCEAERVHALLLVARGTLHAQTVEEVLNNLVTCVLALEQYPDREYASGSGVFVVRRDSVRTDPSGEVYLVGVLAAEVHMWKAALS